MFKIFMFLLLLCVITQKTNSARILCVIGNPSYSHQVFFQPLWRELAIRGHDVVVVTSDPTNETLPNFNEISTHETYAKFKQIMDSMINATFMDIIFKTDWAQKSIEMVNQTVGLPQIKKILQSDSERFDQLIVEHFVSPFLGLKKKFNIPVIGVVSMDAMANSHNVMGNAVHSVLYPSAILPKLDDLSLLQRITAIGLGNMFDLMLYYKPLVKALDIVAKDLFNQSAEDIIESFENTDMLFVNANPVFTPIRPHTPSTISVAGLHIRPPKPLPKDILNYLDNAPQGVIYFSFGGNVKSNELPTNLKQVIINTMGSLPYKVLYKYEEENLPGKPDNMKIIKWGPQQDILRHKNVKLFITQGGAQSVEEALYAHVPMVVVPFFGDQLPIAEKIKQKGLGLSLDRYSLTEDTFKSAIQEVITNPSYRQKVIYYANLVQDEPMTPLEKAVWWTEYVLRHKGAQHLKGPRLPFYQYYYLDVLSVIALLLLVLLSVICGIFICVIKLVKRMCTTKKVKVN